MKEALENSFLLALFQGAMDEVLTRGTTHPKVNQAGLEIPNPTLSVWDNWKAYCVITGHMVAALLGTT